MPISGKMFTPNNDVLTAAGIGGQAGAGAVSNLQGLPSLLEGGKIVPSLLSQADYIIGDVYGLLIDKFAAWFNTPVPAAEKAAAKAASAINPKPRKPATPPANVVADDKTMMAELAGAEAEGSKFAGQTDDENAKNAAEVQKDSKLKKLTDTVKKVGSTLGGHIWAMTKDSGAQYAANAAKAKLQQEFGKAAKASATRGFMNGYIRIQFGISKGANGWAVNGDNTFAELGILSTDTYEIGFAGFEASVVFNDGIILNLAKLNEIVAQMKSGKK